MKKFILLCTLLAVCITFTACSKSEPATKASSGIPDDLVVVLPDGQEIYLYMPHDDAAEILGPADELFKSDDIEGNWYIYNDLGLWLAYTEGLLSWVEIKPESSCQLKSGINPKSKKSDFIKAGFAETHKYYQVEDSTFSPLEQAPDNVSAFHSFVIVDGPYSYELADKPNFIGYTISISDFYTDSNRRYDD